MNPEVVALLEELAADTNKASVTFFPMGLHTHLTSDGAGGWNLEVHSTVENPWEQEEMISHEEHMSTDALVFRMSMLAMIADTFLDAQMEDLTSGLDDELDSFFNSGE